MSILKSIEIGVSEALGTAGEAHQMYHLRQMEKEYGVDITLNILKPHLENVGLTVEQFRGYQQVKEKIQNGELNIGEIRKRTAQLAENVITEVMT